MTADARARVTEIVAGWDASPQAAQELFPLIYDELRGLARSYVAGERAGHSLQATALVNEAYLRLVDLTRIDWRGRTHFLATGARVMRRLLVDHARNRDSLKRGGGWNRVTMGHALGRSDARGLDADELLHLNTALDKLHGLDERQARIVELRFFGGLTMVEIAEHLGVSKRTVEGDWTHARVWLKREVAGSA